VESHQLSKAFLKLIEELEKGMRKNVEEGWKIAMEDALNPKTASVSLLTAGKTRSAGGAYGALKRKPRELQASPQDMGMKIGFPRGGGKRRKRLIAIRG
jgi:hypothetical protein